MLLFEKNDVEGARNLKLLYICEMMSGIKINFIKIEVVLMVIMKLDKYILYFQLFSRFFFSNQIPWVACEY